MSTDFEAAFQNEPVNFLLSNALRHLTQDQQRQLCNALQERLPIPASIEDEAKALYPDEENADMMRNIGIAVQRNAHIACARQYMGEIEKLRAEVVIMNELKRWVAMPNLPENNDLQKGFNCCIEYLRTLLSGRIELTTEQVLEKLTEALK